MTNAYGSSYTTNPVSGFSRENVRLKMSTETAKPSSTMSGKVVDTLGNVVVASLEATAQISLGQGLLRIADRFLWVVEKSAQWSLPVQEVDNEENGKTFGKIELVRPLPWIFFLPSLVLLRACRICVNVGAVILGYPTLQATGMVKIVQKGRRRLRAIKSNGLKHMRHGKSSRNKEEELTEAKKSLIRSMLSTLSALSCLETSRRTPSPPPTRVYVQPSEPETTSTPEEQSTTESTSPLIYSKRKHCAPSSPHWDSTEDKSTEAKLNRWGATWDGPDNDPDYVPREEDLISSDTSSAGEDDGDYISDTEINDLHVDRMLHPYLPGSDDIQLSHVPAPLTSVYEVTSSQDSESEDEMASKPGPKVPAKPATVMNKVSTPNKAEGTKLKPAANETEDNKLNRDEQPVSLVTVNSSETDVDNIVDYYSPINSLNDSINEYQYLPPDEAKDATEELQGELNKTTSKSTTEPEIEAAIEINGTPIISGNSTDGHQTPITNGTTTNDEKRSNHTTGISHSTGKDTDLPQSNEK